MAEESFEERVEELLGKGGLRQLDGMLAFGKPSPKQHDLITGANLWIEEFWPETREDLLFCFYNQVLKAISAEWDRCFLVSPTLDVTREGYYEEIGGIPGWVRAECLRRWFNKAFPEVRKMVHEYGLSERPLILFGRYILGDAPLFDTDKRALLDLINEVWSKVSGADPPSTPSTRLNPDLNTRQVIACLQKGMGVDQILEALGADVASSAGNIRTIRSRFKNGRYVL